MLIQEKSILTTGYVTSRKNEKVHGGLRKTVPTVQADSIVTSIAYKHGQSVFNANANFLVNSKKADPISTCGFELKNIQTNKLCPG